MGQTFSRIWKRIFIPQEITVTIVGLDGSGKTTISHFLKNGKAISTEPSFSFNFLDLEYNNIHFKIWETSGQNNLRSLWKEYIKISNVMVFVLDSRNVERIIEAKNELNKLLLEELLKDVPLLIFSNKQDLPDSLTKIDVLKMLGLEEITGRLWHFQPCSGINGQGLKEGLDWITSIVIKKP